MPTNFPAYLQMSSGRHRDKGRVKFYYGCESRSKVYKPLAGLEKEMIIARKYEEYVTQIL